MLSRTLHPGQAAQLLTNEAFYSRVRIYTGGAGVALCGLALCPQLFVVLQPMRTTLRIHTRGDLMHLECVFGPNAPDVHLLAAFDQQNERAVRLEGDMHVTRATHPDHQVHYMYAYPVLASQPREREKRPRGLGVTVSIPISKRANVIRPPRVLFWPEAGLRDGDNLRATLIVCLCGVRQVEPQSVGCYEPWLFCGGIVLHDDAVEPRRA